MFPMPTDRPRIGDRIRRARQGRRLTQMQLAARIRVDRKTIDNWENDRAHPRGINMAALERELGPLGDGHRTATREEMAAAVRDLEDHARRVAELLGDTGVNGHPGRAS